MQMSFRMATATFLVGAGFIAGCAWLSGSPSVARSEGEIRRLIIGQWFEDQMEYHGPLHLPYVQLDFRADGSCTYALVPTDPHFAPQIDDGFWEVHNRKLTFNWTPREAYAPRRPLLDGEIRLLDRHSFQIYHWALHFDPFTGSEQQLSRWRNRETPNQLMSRPQAAVLSSFA
jgi:hypothetical protein